LRAASYA